MTNAVRRIRKSHPMEGRSSETKIKSPTLISLVSFGFLLSLHWFLMKPSYEGLPPPIFWKEKLSGLESKEIIIAGDSRVLEGVSGEVLSAYLGERDVVNFGFPSAGYGEEYLDAIEAIAVVPRSKVVIVLGITPHSLTSMATKANKFIDERKYLGVAIGWFDKFEARITSRFERVGLPAPGVLIGKLIGNDTETQIGPVLHRYHQMGWRESFVEGKNKDSIDATLKEYSDRFDEEVVDPATVRKLLERCSEWIRNGIMVLAFFPPTCEEMRRLEKEKSQFNMEEFRIGFSRVGGIWISVSEDNLISYDCSHLDSRSALLFSERLGRSIAEAALSEVEDSR
jgi:hypothetical protein